MNINDKHDQVSTIIKDHGLLTGQEFLDLTDNNMELYWAYLDLWDSIIIPDLHDKIQKKIEAAESSD